MDQLRNLLDQLRNLNIGFVFMLKLLIFIPVNCSFKTRF